MANSTVIVSKEIALQINAVMAEMTTYDTKREKIIEIMVKNDLHCFALKIPLQITDFEKIDLN